MIDFLLTLLSEIPEDFFVDIISGGNFMHGALRSMMNILDIDGSTNGQSVRKKTETVASVSAEKVAPLLTDAASRKLVAAALKLKSLAEKRFKWRVTEDVPDHFGVRAGMEAMSIGTHSGDGLRDGFTSTGSIFGFVDEDGPTVVDLNAVMF